MLLVRGPDRRDAGNDDLSNSLSRCGLVVPGKVYYLVWYCLGATGRDDDLGHDGTGVTKARLHNGFFVHPARNPGKTVHV